MKGEKEVYTYGETPLSSIAQIARACEILSKDVVFELGCGRGRASFWLSERIGCEVVGIDRIPFFIEKANKIKEQYHLKNISFRLENLFESNLKGATVIYLYGTCFSTEEITKLLKLFRGLSSGTKVITVSYALNEIVPNVPYRIIKIFPAKFLWGTAMVTLQVKQ